MTFPNNHIKLFPKKIFIILFGLALVFLSNIIGHFAAPFSIMITPLLLPIIIGGLNFALYKSTYYWTVLYGFGLLLLNDVLIRIYAGGTNDDEGKGWIMLFFIIAFLLSGLIMVFFAFDSNKTDKKKKKVIIILTRIIFFFVLAFLVGGFYEKYLSKV